jgi:hypothetical protein
MKKQVYLQPTMTVVKVQQQAHLMQESANRVNSVSSNANITGGNTGSSESARVKEYNVWNDDWSD